MPYSTANTLFGNLAGVIKEDIGTKAERVIRRTMHPFRTAVLEKGKGKVEVIANGSRVGRSYLIKQRFQNRAAGAFRHAARSGYASLFGDVTAPIGTANGGFIPTQQAQRVTQAVMDPRESILGYPTGLTSEMSALDTQLLVPAELQDLRGNPNFIGGELDDLTQAFAEGLGHVVFTSWFLDPDAQYRLSGLGPNTGNGAFVLDGTAFTVTFYPPNGEIHRFMEGQQVDIINPATPTRINGTGTRGAARVICTVQSVDISANKVVLALDTQSFDGTAFTFGTAVTTVTLGNNVSVVTNANHFVDTAGTFSYHGFYTWRHWAVWGGSTNAENRILRGDAITTNPQLDTVDIRSQPRFKSIYRGTFGPFIESTVVETMETVHAAFKPWGYTIDTFMMSRGVWADAWYQWFGMQQIQRAGVPGSLNSLGLDEGISIRVGPRVYEFQVAEPLERGRVVGLRAQGNWAIVTPPGQGGTDGDSEMDSMIPFEFSLERLGMGRPDWPVQITQGGAGSIALPSSEYTMLPGVVRMQFVPTEQIPMVVFDGVNTSLFTTTY